MVQIVKAISRRARLLLLDEPTSSLTDAEVRLVLRLICDLAAQGTGIVFISHYCSEVFEVCDEITMLRDGAVVLAEPTSATSLPSVVAAMIGCRLEAATRREVSTRSAEPLLEVQGALGTERPARGLLHATQGRDPGDHRPDRLGPDRPGQGDLRQPRHAPRGRVGPARRAGAEPARPERGLATGIVLPTNDRRARACCRTSPSRRTSSCPCWTVSPGSWGASTSRRSARSGARPSCTRRSAGGWRPERVHGGGRRYQPLARAVAVVLRPDPVACGAIGPCRGDLETVSMLF